MHVLIVDDHPLFIKGVQALLEEIDPDVTTIGAQCVEDALDIATRTHTDLVMLDLKLPRTQGLEALERVRAAVPDVPIVVVTGSDESEYVWRAIEIGAAGYIPKDTDQPLMIHALQVVLRRGVYLPPQALRAGTSSAACAPAGALSNTMPRPAVPCLSERQISVLQGLLQGKSNKVIARDLDIAEGTVKTHLWSIYQALGVRSRLQAMAKAHELQLVERFSRFI